MSLTLDTSNFKPVVQNIPNTIDIKYVSMNQNGSTILLSGTYTSINSFLSNNPNALQNVPITIIGTANTSYLSFSGVSVSGFKFTLPIDNNGNGGVTLGMNVYGLGVPPGTFVTAVNGNLITVNTLVNPILYNAKIYFCDETTSKTIPIYYYNPLNSVVSYFNDAIGTTLSLSYPPSLSQNLVWNATYVGFELKTIAMSSDGTYIVGGGFSGNGVSKSNDAGKTWKWLGDIAPTALSSAVSANGKYQAVGGHRSYCMSSDYGNTFIKNNNGFFKNNQFINFSGSITPSVTILGQTANLSFTNITQGTYWKANKGPNLYCFIDVYNPLYQYQDGNGNGVGVNAITINTNTFGLKPNSSLPFIVIFTNSSNLTVTFISKSDNVIFPLTNSNSFCIGFINSNPPDYSLMNINVVNEVSPLNVNPIVLTFLNNYAFNPPISSIYMPLPLTGYTYIAMDTIGQNQTISMSGDIYDPSPSLIFMSSDFGVSWGIAKIQYIKNENGENVSIGDWMKLSMTSYTNQVALNSNGYIYSYNASSNIWIPFTPSNSTGLIYPNIHWNSISISAAGNIVVTQDNSNIIYSSANNGALWKTIEFSASQHIGNDFQKATVHQSSIQISYSGQYQLLSMVFNGEQYIPYTSYRYVNGSLVGSSQSVYTSYSTYLYVYFSNQFGVNGSWGIAKTSKMNADFDPYGIAMSGSGLNMGLVYHGYWSPNPNSVCGSFILNNISAVNNSNQLTISTYNPNIVPGMTITGAGIQSGTIILSTNSNSKTITISKSTNGEIANNTLITFSSVYINITILDTFDSNKLSVASNITDNIVPGMIVSGTGIPINTTIVSVGIDPIKATRKTITISNNVLSDVSNNLTISCPPISPPAAGTGSTTVTNSYSFNTGVHPYISYDGSKMLMGNDVINFSIQPNVPTSRTVINGVISQTYNGSQSVPGQTLNISSTNNGVTWNPNKNIPSNTCSYRSTCGTIGDSTGTFIYSWNTTLYFSSGGVDGLFTNISAQSNSGLSSITGNSLVGSTNNTIGIINAGAMSDFITNGNFLYSIFAIKVIQDPNLSGLYYSNTSANKFSLISNTSTPWISLSMSVDGKYILALSETGLYLSVNGNDTKGASSIKFTQIKNVSVNFSFENAIGSTYQLVTMSADGNVMMALDQSTNTLYFSTNYGTTWNSTNYFSNNFNPGIYNIKMSPDTSTLAIIIKDSSDINNDKQKLSLTHLNYKYV